MRYVQRLRGIAKVLVSCGILLSPSLYSVPSSLHACQETRVLLEYVTGGKDDQSHLRRLAEVIGLLGDPSRDQSCAALECLISILINSRIPPVLHIGVLEWLLRSAEFSEALDWENESHKLRFGIPLNSILQTEGYHSRVKRMAALGLMKLLRDPLRPDAEPAIVSRWRYRARPSHARISTCEKVLLTAPLYLQLPEASAH